MVDFTQRRVTMVDTQVRPADVTKFPILDAMLSVPREKYVPDAARDLAYMDNPINLGGGRQLLDARAIGKLLEVLEPTPKDLVLEIGAGLGYTTALLAHLAEAVVAVEEDEDLARDAEQVLTAEGVDNAALIAGPLAAGSAKHGPFDVIAIFGGVEEIPDAIIDQLKDGGHIAAVFMEGAVGEVRVGVKAGGTVTWRMAFNATAPGSCRALPALQPSHSEPIKRPPRHQQGRAARPNQKREQANVDFTQTSGGRNRADPDPCFSCTGGHAASGHGRRISSFAPVGTESLSVAHSG